MAIVYVGLGSNLDQSIKHITTAFVDLSQIPNSKLINKSSLYRTQPVGEVKQDDFINAIALLTTKLTPLDFLSQLQQIENQHQRQRQIKWGPRTLDLDLLLYDDEMINLPDLQIPHPEISKRNFVLIPLAEISPNLIISQQAIIKLINQNQETVIKLD